MKPQSIMRYIEQDEEYMYFEVYVLDLDKNNSEYESVGTIYIPKVKGIER